VKHHPFFATGPKQFCQRGKRNHTAKKEKGEGKKIAWENTLGFQKLKRLGGGGGEQED